MPVDAPTTASNTNQPTTAFEPTNRSELAKVIALYGEAPQVVISATYGWYWAVDLLQDLGAIVHLANPRALNWGDRASRTT